MLRNNNRMAVKKLGIRFLQQNNTRNLFVVLSIILTTFMFTTVFGIGFSLVKNVNKMQLRMQGTKTTVILRKPDREQIKQAKKAKSLYAAGIQILTGIAADTDEKIHITMDFFDETEFEKNLKPAISDIEGTYPLKENEIMLPVAVLNVLQIHHPKIGTDIMLMTESGEKTFFLSGWFTEFAHVSGQYQGLISKSYADVLGKTVEKDGILCLSATAGKQEKLLEELGMLVKLQEEQNFESIYDVQGENRDNAFVVVPVILIMSFIVVLSGYLFISNIMYISVTKDIHFYGMLKTIGMSPSQLKAMVKLQARRLSVIGIPIGMFLGITLSFVIIPIAHIFFKTGQDGMMPSDVSFHPLIYIGTILFALITVNISCHKPAKLAGKISAMEAMKYNGFVRVGIRTKRTMDGGKLYKMAFRNVFRERKRAFLVFASLFIGTMAFLTVGTFVGSQKIENYIKYYLPNDFAIFVHSSAEEDTKEERARNIQYANELANEVENIDGVTRVWINRFVNGFLSFDENVYQPFLERDFTDDRSRQETIAFYKEHADEQESAYQTQVVAVGSRMLEIYQEKTGRNIDIKRFEKGEICLIGFVNTLDQAEAIEGKSVIISDTPKGFPLSLEVGCCAIMEEHDLFNIEHHWTENGTPNCILISETAMRELCGEAPIQNIIMDCEPEAENDVKERVRELTETNPSVSYTIIKSQYKEEFRSSIKSQYILGGGISMILFAIGMMNFINVMMTSVFVRRREFAVLESIGMTRRQLKRMLTYEGICYGVGTLTLIFTLGNVIIYLVASFSQQIANYAVFHYPVGFMCIISVTIMAICIFVPDIIYRMVSKESVTERRRAME